jgi:hypothetical protein
LKDSSRAPELNVSFPELAFSPYLKGLERKLAQQRQRRVRDDQTKPSGGAIHASEDSTYQTPYYVSSSDDEWVPSRDEIPSTLVYDFNPQLQACSREYETSDIESPLSDIGGSGATTFATPKPAKYMGIYDANYTGDACLWGNHTVSLTAVRGARRRYAPQFRWL